jgi:NADH:ubiquinone oxidoreductase subunit 6 (subunit J)
MADLIFIALAVVTIGGAIVAMEVDEIIYGAIGLAGSLFGVATLFFLLDAPYVAAFQITVYVGAVAVLILFTVMLVKQENWAKEVPPRSMTKLMGVLMGLAVVVVLSLAAIWSNLSGDTDLQNNTGFLQIGQLISTVYSPALVVLALVLAASLVGALTLSSVDKEEKQE